MCTKKKKKKKTEEKRLLPYLDPKIFQEFQKLIFIWSVQKTHPYEWLGS